MTWVPYMYVVISGLSNTPVADLSSSDGGGVGSSFVGLPFLAPLPSPELASPPPRSRPSRPARPLASRPGGTASAGTSPTCSSPLRRLGYLCAPSSAPAWRRRCGGLRRGRRRGVG